MRTEALVTFWIAAAMLVAACAPGNSATGTAPHPASADEPRPADVHIRPSAIDAHIRYLASDLMEGREAGTRGYDLAAGYIASQFRLLGLRPAGSDTDYFQEVPLQAHWVVRDGARMIVRPERGGRVTRLVLGEDFVVSSSPTRAASTVTAPAVFVGYGVDAPAFKHDDYAGLDVTGKIVVLLAGYPSAFPSEEGAHYGSSREKARAAAARGAIGMVTLYTRRYESVYPWQRAVSTLDSMSMTWIGESGPFAAAPGIRATAMMSPTDGAVLFEGAERSYEQVREEASKGAPRGFPLAVSLEIAQASRQERRASANVAGVLAGSDPKLRDEYVVMVGHLDHEGIGAPVNGDRIYNGALDNAAGIAGLLEAARALADAPTAPRRSILFLAVTAEEKGLLGSEYFALHPTVPRDRIVAAVNLDMPVLLYDFTDVIAFGAEHSTLKGIVESALAGMDLALTPDPMPEQAVFTRSDHYRFVQQGIPSIFLSTGWNTAAGKGEGGKAFQRFLETNYHQPSDDLRQPIDVEAGAKFARVNYEILKAIANADARPAWNEGDFFGALFAAER